MPPTPRVASLFPSATELVAAVGSPDCLVARSHRCDHPPPVREAPAVTVSDIGGDDDPAEPAVIDAAVDDHAHGAGSHFRVVADRLAAARPDVVLTQSLCEVCAVPESMTAAALATLDSDPDLVSLAPTTIGGVLDSVERVGRALGHDAAGETLAADLRERVAAVERRRPDPAAPPRVVCIEWTDPLRCHGLWMAEAVERLGAEPGFGEPGHSGEVIDWEAVVAYDPEVLVVSPCGRSVPEIREDLDALIRRGWKELTAVREGRVYLLDGRLSSRHGPRVVRALELLAGMVYPGTAPDDWSEEEAVRVQDAAGV